MTYEQADQILNDCTHAEGIEPFLRSPDGTLRAVCYPCHTAYYNAHKQARKEEVAVFNAAQPLCDRCGMKPRRWTLCGWNLCTKCKTATKDEHHKTAARMGVFGLISGLMVDTSSWKIQQAIKRS